MSKRKFVSVEVCPFDDLPCDYVNSCDDVLAVQYGFIPPFLCPRAVVKVRKK